MMLKNLLFFYKIKIFYYCNNPNTSTSEIDNIVYLLMQAKPFAILFFYIV